MEPAALQNPNVCLALFSSFLAGSTEAVCRLLTVLLLHHSPVVRLAAQSAGKSVAASDPALLGPLMAALRQWPDMGAALPGLTVSHHQGHSG